LSFASFVATMDRFETRAMDDAPTIAAPHTTAAAAMRAG
jgi:hypothetical protein